jgi:hypothetical protein
MKNGAAMLHSIAILMKIPEAGFTRQATAVLHHNV